MMYIYIYKHHPDHHCQCSSWFLLLQGEPAMVRRMLILMANLTRMKELWNTPSVLISWCYLHTQTILVGKKDVRYDFLYLYGSVWVFVRCFSLSPKGTLFHSILQSQAPRAKPFSSPPPCGSMVYFCPSMESMRGTVHTVLTERGWSHAHTIHGGRRVMFMQDRTVGPAVTAWRLG